MFPGDAGYPGHGDARQRSYGQFAPRARRDLEPARTTTDERPRGLGHVLRHAAPVLQHALRQQPAVGRADHADQSRRRLRQPVSDLPGRQPVPGAARRTGPTPPFPAFGVYVNTPLDLHNTPHSQQWNVSVQRAVGDWLFARQLPRQPREPPVARDRTEPGRLRPGRDDRQHASAAHASRRCRTRRRARSTARSAQLDDTGRANYHGMLLSAQRRLKNNWSVLTNYTLSKCMTDPATTEITGADDRRSEQPGRRLRVLRLGSPPRVQRVGRRRGRRRSPARLGASDQRLADRADRPVAVSGNRSTVTTGVDNALTGHGRPARGAGARRSLRRRHGGELPEPAAFAAAGRRAPTARCKPFTIVNPSPFQNDLGDHAHVQDLRETSLQFRWEIFNVINHVNFNAPDHGAQQRELRAASSPPATRASCSSR